MKSLSVASRRWALWTGASAGRKLATTPQQSTRRTSFQILLHHVPYTFAFSSVSRVKYRLS